MTNAKTTAEQRYSYQAINGSGGLGEHHYRIADAGDNRIATCYLEGNARLIVDELNRLASAESRCRALEEVVRELVDMEDECCRNEPCKGCVAKRDRIRSKALALLSEGATGGK